MIPIEEVPPAPQAPDPKRVERRLLTPEEIQEFIKPVYDKAGHPLPNPANSGFIGALRGGKVKAFIGLQVMLHAEPLWIEEGEAALLSGLIAEAEKVILEKMGAQWVYVFATPGKVARTAEMFGMQLEPFCIYSKLVTAPVPVKPLSILEDPVDFDEVIQ